MKSKLLQDIEAEWAPSDIKTVTQWADLRRVLTRTTSSEPGPWKTDRTPYLRFVMDCFSEPSIRMICLKFATQLGKSEAQLNMVGFIIDILGGSILHVLPTDNVTEKFSRTRIKPMVEACPTLRSKKHSNQDLFQNREMHYQDAIHYLATANSAADLKSTPIEFLFCDEVGSFPEFAGRDADPVKLAMERQKTFSLTKKAVLVSSPTTENGLITKYHRDCDLHYQFFVSCPQCGHYQTLVFPQIKWPDMGDTSEQSTRLKVKRAARYECVSCQKPIDDRQKPEMLRKGEWRADEADFEGDPESVGFHLNSLYSPFLSWGDIAYEFLDSKNDIGRLMNFKNGWEAIEWTQAVATKKTGEILAHRVPLPPLTVPAEAVALTCGIDVQKFSFYYTVRAWARNMTSWLIRYGQVETWDEINEILFTDSYPVVGTDKSMRVWRCFVDTGGTEGAEGVSMTEETYTWLRNFSRGIVFGIKGQSTRTAERVRYTVIDRMPGRKGLPIPGGLRLFLLNTSELKDALAYRLDIPIDQPGAWLLHEEVGDDYARHITNEEKRIDRKGKAAWQAVGPQHWLDAEVYALAAADPQAAGGVRVLSSPVYAVTHTQGEPNPAQGRRISSNWLKRPAETTWLNRGHTADR